MLVETLEALVLTKSLKTEAAITKTLDCNSVPQDRGGYLRRAGI
jgi:hypothetical protein